jgi:hypothetical protein
MLHDVSSMTGWKQSRINFGNAEFDAAAVHQSIVATRTLGASVSVKAQYPTLHLRQRAFGRQKIGIQEG